MDSSVASAKTINLLKVSKDFQTLEVLFYTRPSWSHSLSFGYLATGRKRHMTTGGARNSLDLVLIWPYLGICTARAFVKWSSRCLAKSAYSHLLRPLVLPLQMKSTQNNGHVLSSSRYQLANQLPSTVQYFKKCSSISSNKTQQVDEHRQL